MSYKERKAFSADHRNVSAYMETGAAAPNHHRQSTPVYEQEPPEADRSYIATVYGDSQTSRVNDAGALCPH